MTDPNLLAFAQTANPQAYYPLDPTNVYANPVAPTTPYGLGGEQLFFVTPPAAPETAQVPNAMQMPVYLPREQRNPDPNTGNDDKSNLHGGNAKDLQIASLGGQFPGAGPGDFASGAGNFFGGLVDGVQALYNSPIGVALPGGFPYKVGQVVGLWGNDANASERASRDRVARESRMEANPHAWGNSDRGADRDRDRDRGTNTGGGQRGGRGGGYGSGGQSDLGE